MCNDYEQHVIRKLFAETVAPLDLGLKMPAGDATWPTADDIRPGQRGPVVRAAGNGIEVAPMIFGWPPKDGRRPVINIPADSEKNGERKVKDFSKSHRCVIVASAFFEFQGQRSPKAKYRFALRQAPFIGVAGIWVPGASGKEDSAAMLTVVPGPDVEPIHDRQIVILGPSQYGRWLSYDSGVQDLLQPLPAGSLSVEQVRPEAPPKRELR